MLRFWASKLHFWRKSRRNASFWSLKASFLKEVSQKSFVLELQRFNFEGSLAEKLRFWASKLRFWRKSRRNASFLSFKASILKEVSQKSFVFDLQSFVFEGSLAEMLRFWASKLQFWRKSRTKADNQNHLNLNSFESDINWLSNQLNSAHSLPISSLSLETSATALCGRYVTFWYILIRFGYTNTNTHPAYILVFHHPKCPLSSDGSLYGRIPTKRAADLPESCNSLYLAATPLSTTAEDVKMSKRHPACLRISGTFAGLVWTQEILRYGRVTLMGDDLSSVWDHLTVNWFMWIHLQTMLWVNRLIGVGRNSGHNPESTMENTHSNQVHTGR